MVIAWMTLLLIHMKYQYARNMLRLLHDVCTICTISSYELGIILCLIMTVNMEFYIIGIIARKFVFWHHLFRYSFVSSHFCWHYILGFFTRPHISCVCGLQKFVVILQFAAVSSSWTWTHMPVDMIKTCSFFNCQTCKQIPIIVLNKRPSF